MIRKTKPFARILTALSALVLMTLSAPAMAAGFASPSGNIKCYVDIYSDGPFDNAPMICLISRADWDLPPDYGDGNPTCNLDRTRAIFLPPSGAATARWICHGDVFWPAPLGRISYGSQWSLSHYTCAMARDGVRCTNGSGNEFAVKSAGWSAD